MDVSLLPQRRKAGWRASRWKSSVEFCHSRAIPFIERPVERTELHIADEIRLARYARRIDADHPA